jgi:hypothetical protein
MAKLASAKKVGIPVPTTLPTDVTHLVAYFGPKGFTPAYDQEDRIETPIEDVEQRQVGPNNYFVFDTAQLPAIDDEEFDLYFTLADINDSEEGDFSPVVSVPLDRVPPTTLDQPVLLAD